MPVETRRASQSLAISSRHLQSAALLPTQSFGTQPIASSRDFARYRFAGAILLTIVVLLSIRRLRPKYPTRANVGRTQ